MLSDIQKNTILAAMSREELVVLLWLAEGGENRGFYGECKGAALDGLMRLELAELGEVGPRGRDFSWVRLTEAGEEVAAEAARPPAFTSAPEVVEPKTATPPGASQPISFVIPPGIVGMTMSTKRGTVMVNLIPTSERIQALEVALRQAALELGEAAALLSESNLPGMGRIIGKAAQTALQVAGVSDGQG